MSLDANQPSAVILFAHGARDPEWARPFENIRALVLRALPNTAVELAFLERMSPDLDAAVEHVRSLGAQRVTVVPLFLASGGHVKEDLAAMVVAVQRRYPSLHIHVTQPIGESEELVSAIAAWVVRHHEASGESSGL